MAKKIVSIQSRQKEGPAAAAKPLTLADIRVTHTIGSRTITRTGAILAQLIEATQHLHAPEDDDLDFLNPSAIAIELDGVADVLCCLSEAEAFALDRALPCVGEQLRRIARRVSALAPTSANQLPDWYKVEVKR
jgi:hypothetical protein